MCTQSGPNNLNNNNPRQNTTDESHGRRSRRFRNKTALRNDSITDRQMELQAAVLHYCSRRRNNKTGRWSISTFSSLSLVSLIHFVRHNGEQLIGQISGTAAGRNCRFDVTQIELKTCSSAPPSGCYKTSAEIKTIFAGRQMPQWIRLGHWMLVRNRQARPTATDQCYTFFCSDALCID